MPHAREDPQWLQLLADNLEFEPMASSARAGSSANWNSATSLRAIIPCRTSASKLWRMSVRCRTDVTRSRAHTAGKNRWRPSAVGLPAPTEQEPP